MSFCSTDVIVPINEIDIKTMEDLRKHVMNSKIGEKLRIKFHRAREIFETYVELTSVPWEIIIPSLLKQSQSM